MPESDLEKLIPLKDLSKEEKAAVFEHINRRLAIHRNNAERWANAEAFTIRNESKRDEFNHNFEELINEWANALLKNAWMACDEPGQSCPTINSLSDTSLRDLPNLPPPNTVSHILNTILLLHITSTKHYSAHTRAFLFSLGTLAEDAASATLHDPAHAAADASTTQDKARAAQAQQSRSNRTLRALGIGGAAVVGGVLVGVTGGLAAPLVGAGVSTLLGAVGLGGSAAGVLAAGLAGSSAVCGALFGAYGAREGSQMVARHTKDVADFEIVPVRPTRETLAVRVCVSGWLGDRKDVTAPWTVYDDSEDTFALQWEVEALEKLSTALTDLVKSQLMSFVKSGIIKHTFLAALFASLSPVALLKVGKIIDNPWANAKALADKTGRVLGVLLAKRAFGNRPVTLTGYSLGALVVLTALEYLASLELSLGEEGGDKDKGGEDKGEGREAAHVVQDVFLMGAPVPADGTSWPWARARRVVAGRLVNAYTSPESDYVLAFLSRVSFSSISSAATSSSLSSSSTGGGSSSSSSFGVAGLQPVDVAGVENVKVEGVEGHVAWRGLVGRCLAVECRARGVRVEVAEEQETVVGGGIKREIEDGQRGAGESASVYRAEDVDAGVAAGGGELTQAVARVELGENEIIAR